MKSITCRAKTTTSPAAESGAARSRRRKRTEREAIDLLDAEIRRLGRRLTGDRRRSALARIRGARQPVAEARRIVAGLARDMSPETAGADVDLSDVQELRVALIRRHGVIDETLAMLLARMERLVATDGLSRNEFTDLAAVARRLTTALGRRRKALARTA